MGPMWALNIYAFGLPADDKNILYEVNCYRAMLDLRRTINTSYRKSHSFLRVYIDYGHIVKQL